MKIKQAVVTGAGGGIGQETAKKLTASGYMVYLVGRTEKKLQVTAEKCRNHQGETKIITVDISQKEQVYSSFAHLDKIDLILANAGNCVQNRLDDPKTDEIWSKVIDTNLNGVWYTFRALHNKLKEGGRAVVISSGLGKLVRAGYCAYTASKNAVNGLGKCFSKELAPRKITVNSVCPNWVDTSMARGDLEKTALENNTNSKTEYERAISSIPLQRFVQPEEVASLVVWLTSEEASAITGQAYNISCGEFFA